MGDGGGGGCVSLGVAFPEDGPYSSLDLFVLLGSRLLRSGGFARRPSFSFGAGVCSPIPVFLFSGSFAPFAAASRALALAFVSRSRVFSFPDSDSVEAAGVWGSALFPARCPALFFLGAARLAVPSSAQVSHPPVASRFLFVFLSNSFRPCHGHCHGTLVRLFRLAGPRSASRDKLEDGWVVQVLQEDRQVGVSDS